MQALAIIYMVPQELYLQLLFYTTQKLSDIESAPSQACACMCGHNLAGLAFCKVCYFAQCQLSVHLQLVSKVVCAYSPYTLALINVFEVACTVKNG